MAARKDINFTFLQAGSKLFGKPTVQPTVSLFKRNPDFFAYNYSNEEDTVKQRFYMVQFNFCSLFEQLKE